MLAWEVVNTTNHETAVSATWAAKLNFTGWLRVEGRDRGALHEREGARAPAAGAAMRLARLARGLGARAPHLRALHGQARGGHKGDAGMLAGCVLTKLADVHVQGGLVEGALQLGGRLLGLVHRDRRGLLGLRGRLVGELTG
jgi:hypothetical protein